MRRKAPLFSGVYALGTRTKTNSQGTFWVYDIEDHAAAPFVADDQIELMEQLHDEFTEVINARRIQVDYDEDAAAGEGEGGGANTY